MSEAVTGPNREMISAMSDLWRLHPPGPDNILVRLDEAGMADAALADRDLANAVACHKAMFFAEKAADRSPIDYAVAVNGGLKLAPGGEAAKALEEDYGRMIKDGLLLEDAGPFEALMARCADIAERANRAAA